MKLWVLMLLLAVQWGVNRKNKEGAELYEEGKLDEALRAFTEAQIESPDAPEIHYNIGNVHYRKGDLDKALEEYRAALGGQAEVRRRDLFNIGNIFFNGQSFDGAVEAYKEALKIDPNDLEARQNLELALRREEEQQQQGGGNDQDENDEEQQKQSQQEDSPQGRSEQEEQSDEQQASRAQPKGGEEDERTMSKQEAVRILAALEEMEKEEQRRQQQRNQLREPGESEKVW